jgi:hypothetical protein
LSRLTVRSLHPSNTEEEYDKDTLSGPLFTLTIEPFLLLCNDKLRDYGLKIPSSKSKTLVTSAHADDITLFIIQDEGFPHMLQSFMVYGGISGATLNIQKSKGFFCRTMEKQNRQTAGFSMERTGWKVPRDLARKHRNLATKKLD